MIDPSIIETATIAMAALIALSMVTQALSRGWQGWLVLQERVLTQAVPKNAALPAAARIEIADLKERVRLLEAIAAGVDP